MSKKLDAFNAYELPVRQDNEALILANAIKDVKNREMFIKRVMYNDFRTEEFKTVAWAIKRAVDEKMEITIDSILLKSSSSPVRNTLTATFLNDITTNYKAVNLSDYERHIKELKLDGIKASIIDSTFSSLYKICLNPAAELGEVEKQLDLLKTIVKTGYSSSILEFKSMDEVVAEYVANFGKKSNFRTTGFRHLDAELNEGLRGGAITIVAGLAHMGKSLNFYTPVLMSDGHFKLAKDIRQGDFLMGVDSKPRRVDWVNTGFGPMYRIDQIRGDSYTVNGPHVLALRRTTVQYSKTTRHLPKEQRVITHDKNTPEFIEVEDYIKKTDAWKKQYKGYKVDGWELPYKKTLIDPYWLGLWLGDGTLRNTLITNPEPEVIDYIYKYASELGQDVTVGDKQKTDCKGYNTVSHTQANNPLLDMLRTYSFMEKGKYIPDEYLYNSREVRLQMLAGLLYTDGYLTGRCFEITTKYEELKNGIVYLARSLGMYVSFQYAKKVVTSIGFEGMYWRIQISGDTHTIPTKVKRKQAAVCESPRDILNTGISVTPVGDGEYVSITLDPTTDQLFILGDGTVTHNSSFTLSMMKNLANKRVPTAQFALEMNNMSLTTKMLAYNSGIPVTLLTKDIEKLSEIQKRVYDYEMLRLKDNKFMWLNDKPSQSLAQIREQTMMLQDHLKQEYIVIPIDLFGKIRDFASSENFARDYETKLNEAQVMTRELGVHYILVAQINREVGKGKLKRPKMANLKNAGAFEEVADNIFAVHRPYYDSDKALKEEIKKKGLYQEEDDGEEVVEVEKYLAEILILKQRMGANNKIVNFYMDPNTTRFQPWDTVDQEILNQAKYLDLNREED